MEIATWAGLRTFPELIEIIKKLELKLTWINSDIF
jgi:hypothetical protein